MVQNADTLIGDRLSSERGGAGSPFHALAARDCQYLSSTYLAYLPSHTWVRVYAAAITYVPHITHIILAARQPVLSCTVSWVAVYSCRKSRVV